MKSSNIKEKFSLFIDLGCISVPSNYVHDTQLSLLDKEKFFYFCPFIKDVFYFNPIRILKPNEKILVKAFSQEVESTSSEQRISFLKKQRGNILPGVQGTVLVLQQKLKQLPENFWYSSFERDLVNYEEHLPNLGICSDSYNRCKPDKKFIFGHHQLNQRWDAGDILLAFYEL